MAVDSNPYRSAGWTPERAQEQLDALMQDKTFLAAWTDKMSAMHEQCVKARQHLFEVIGGEPPPADSVPRRTSTEPLPAERIAEAQRSPYYLDPTREHPKEHAAAVAEVLAAHEALAKEGGQQ